MNENLPDLTPWFTPGGPTQIGDMSSEMFLGYMVGCRDTYQKARADIEAEIADACAERSVQIVHNHARIPARDRAADQKKAAASEAWWADRREGRKEAA